MAVLGFNYDKLLAEKMKPVKGKVSINNNVTVTNVEKTDVTFLKEKSALEVEFKYTSNYSPEVAKIVIEGSLIYVNEGKKVDELIKEWEKEKRLPRDIMTEVLNYILGKCNVQAILMSKDLNIPSPIPLPKVTGEKDEKKGSKSS